MTHATVPAWGRADRYCLAALVLLAVALWLPRLRGPLDLRYDAGVYYILGTSLAEGRGYRLLNEPGAIEAIQYPPLLPAVGALVERAAGTDDPAMVVAWWMDEPPDGWHRRNILDADQRDVGVGYCFATEDASGNHHYWTADFSRRGQ